MGSCVAARRESSGDSALRTAAMRRRAWIQQRRDHGLELFEEDGETRVKATRAQRGKRRPGPASLLAVEIVAREDAEHALDVSQSTPVLVSELAGIEYRRKA